ncbi:MAG: hypothetical protein R3B06_31475 [Kofleriaceae bacterium]
MTRPHVTSDAALWSAGGAHLSLAGEALVVSATGVAPELVAPRRRGQGTTPRVRPS